MTQRKGENEKKKENKENNGMDENFNDQKIATVNDPNGHLFPLYTHYTRYPTLCRGNSLCISFYGVRTWKITQLE